LGTCRHGTLILSTNPRPRGSTLEGRHPLFQRRGPRLTARRRGAPGGPSSIRVRLRSWSLYGAQRAQPLVISGKRPSAGKRRKQAESVATGCHRLRSAVRGKGRVDATSLLLKRGHLPGSAKEKSPANPRARRTEEDDNTSTAKELLSSAR
jgi:hypothetical protein